MTIALKTVAPLILLQDARAHLEAAISQSIPTDDRIIVEHMKSAEVLLRALIEAQLP